MVINIIFITKLGARKINVHCKLHKFSFVALSPAVLLSAMICDANNIQLQPSAIISPGRPGPGLWATIILSNNFGRSF